MILIFGGTTEGRKAVEVLEEAGSPFFYSTKTGEQDLTLQHGNRINGAMDAETMKVFIASTSIAPSIRVPCCSVKSCSPVFVL